MTNAEGQAVVIVAGVDGDKRTYQYDAEGNLIVVNAYHKEGIATSNYQYDSKKSAFSQIGLPSWVMIECYVEVYGEFSFGISNNILDYRHFEPYRNSSYATHFDFDYDADGYPKNIVLPTGERTDNAFVYKVID